MRTYDIDKLSLGAHEGSKLGGGGFGGHISWGFAHFILLADFGALLYQRVNHLVSVKHSSLRTPLVTFPKGPCCFGRGPYHVQKTVAALIDILGIDVPSQKVIEPLQISSLEPDTLQTCGWSPPSSKGAYLDGFTNLLVQISLQVVLMSRRREEGESTCQQMFNSACELCHTTQSTYVGCSSAAVFAGEAAARLG